MWTANITLYGVQIYLGAWLTDGTQEERKTKDAGVVVVVGVILARQLGPASGCLLPQLLLPLLLARVLLLLAWPLWSTPRSRRPCTQPFHD